jgi:hypothetical protein
MQKLFKISVIATALLGALLAVNYQPKIATERMVENCCGDPPQCPDPINPMCPPSTDGLQAR